jgi:hypothetical protein
MKPDSVDPARADIPRTSPAPAAERCGRRMPAAETRGPGRQQEGRVLATRMALESSGSGNQVLETRALETTTAAFWAAVVSLVGEEL